MSTVAARCFNTMRQHHHMLRSTTLPSSGRSQLRSSLVCSTRPLTSLSTMRFSSSIATNPSIRLSHSIAFSSNQNRFNNQQQSQLSRRQMQRQLPSTTTSLTSICSKSRINNNSSCRCSKCQFNSTSSRSFSTRSLSNRNRSKSSINSSSHLTPHIMNRALHSSPPRENAVAIALVVSGLAIYGARAAYRSAKAWRPDQQMASGATDPNRLVDDDNPLPGQDTSRFYAGGFEDKMSRREAALILGVRENASKEKIIQQYRQLMRVNHPDLGGSPYISSKVNEAKDLLHKSARSEADGGGK